MTLLGQNDSRRTGRTRWFSAFVAAASMALSLALVTARPAGAAELSAGNILVTDTFPNTLFTVSPMTGATTSVSVGGLGGQVDVGLGGQVVAIDPDTRELISVDPSNGDQTVIVGGFDYVPADLAIEWGGDVLIIDGTQLIRVDPTTASKTVLHDYVGSGRLPKAVTVEADGDVILGSMSGVTVYLHRIDPASGDEELLFSAVCPASTPRGCITNLWDIAAAPDGAIVLLDPGRGVFRLGALADELEFLGGLFAGTMEGLAVEADGDVLFGYFESGSDFSGLYRIERDAPGDETKLADFDRPVGVAVVPEVDARSPSVFFGTPADGAAFQPNEVIPASYACFDGASGIASCVGDVAPGSPIDTSFRLPFKTFTVTATDNAGNTTTRTHHYLIDGMRPTIVITTPPEGAVYAIGQVVVSQYSCDDDSFALADSGIDTCISSAPDQLHHVPTSTPGRNSFTVTATDRAGNTAILTHTYTVAGNDPPQASDQTVSTIEDAPVAFTLSGSDPDGDALSFAVDLPPRHGSLTGDAPALTYSPAPDFNGDDGLTYTVDDGGGGTDAAIVTVRVVPVNDAPSFVPGSNVSVSEDSGAYAASWATAISTGPPNEVDQGRAFRVTGTTNPGLFSSSPTIAPDGSVRFTPAPNANGAAVVTVVLQDGGGTANGGEDTSAPSSFTVIVNAVNDHPFVTITGGQCASETSASAGITLTVGDIESPPGALVVSATSGNQVLLPNRGLAAGGNTANRTIAMTSAPHRHGTALVVIAVSDGTDSTTATFTVVVGTAADDRLTGTPGADVLFGLAGMDSLSGAGGRDLLCGGNGADTLTGGEDDDVLDGGRGDDILTGGAGNDRLLGQEGNDTLTGGTEADFMSGGSGADTATDLRAVEGDTHDRTVP